MLTNASAIRSEVRTDPRAEVGERAGATGGLARTLGRATATLQLPPGFIGGPVMADFAAAFVDLTTNHVVGTTNAVSLSVGP